MNTIFILKPLNVTPSVPLSLSFENRAPLTIPLPERQTQWDGGSTTEMLFNAGTITAGFL